MDRVKRIWYLSPMRAAKVQASLRIRAVSPEPPLLAHTSSESRGIFRQKARSLAPLNGWACAVKTCHDGMLEDTNSLDAAQMIHHISSIQSRGFILRAIPSNTFQPEHDKTSKKICVPNEVTDQLIRVFAVRVKNVWVLSYPWSAQQRLCYLTEVQADLSFRLANRTFSWFCRAPAFLT